MRETLKRLNFIKKYGDRRFDELLCMFENGASVEVIKKEFGVSKQSVYYWKNLFRLGTYKRSYSPGVEMNRNRLLVEFKVDAQRIASKKYRATDLGKLSMRRAAEALTLRKMLAINNNIKCYSCIESIFERLLVSDGKILCYSCRFERPKIFEHIKHLTIKHLTIKKEL